MQSLIIVSNRLPVTVSETITQSSGGLVSAVEGFRGSMDFRWIGWAGGIIPEEDRRRRIENELAERFSYYPIFLEQEDIEAFYTGFSNSSLWPLLHYHPGYAQYDQRWFQKYREVNQIFADKILEHLKADDIVWIHDYHLMLLPAMIRERRPEAKIGFFLHTPFPSYEIFRCHPNRSELLLGLLGADLIGFHTSSYLRHFRSTVLRLLGFESEINTILTDTHEVAIGVYPISIPVNKFDREMQSADYHRHLEHFRREYAEKKIVLSVERLDYTKGVPRRLEAIERFLEYSGRRDVVFIFINVPSRESVTAYQDLRSQIELKVSQINGRYATITNAPVHFIHQSVDFSALCALYSLADVAMVTPLIDGMNLVAKEYLYCQKDTSGVLILSEFAGAAQELHQAILVNPYNVDEIARSMERALAMPDEEKQNRLTPMRNRIRRYDAQRWARSFIADLADAQSTAKEVVEPQRLTPDVLQAFWQSTNIALFLDYDGTLAELRRSPEDAVPDAAVRRLFNRLRTARRSRLEIYLLSGRPRQDVDRWLGEYGFHLIAEHGYYYKHRSASEWVAFDNQADLSWMPEVKDILMHYTDMTPGTEVEEKTASLVWHYRNAEPEFGRWKAHQLVDELRSALSNLPLQVHHGSRNVEVGSILINKGVILQYMRNVNHYDSVLCAGDDETDEAMFRSADPDDITIKVGTGATEARYLTTSPRALRNLLEQMASLEP